MPPDRRPTIADVAAAAGVSKGAVSFALNGRKGVAATTRDRIMRAADDLGWEPDQRARGLSTDRAYAVGWVVPRPAMTLAADPFFPLFLAGLETALAEAGRGLVLNVVDAFERQAATYRRLAKGRVDGVLLTDLQAGDERIPLLADLGLATLAVGRPQNGGENLPWVGIDDRVGITAAVDHLVDLGHRRVAHVQGVPGYVHTTSRRAAWEHALTSKGLDPGPVATGNFTGEGGAAATRALLAEDPRPTAIVYANDLMAVGGMQVLGEAGLRVPGDISVVGFDDIAVASLLAPPLTTVRHDVVGWGRAAATALLAITEHLTPETGWLDPPELVVRRSTAPPAT